MFLSDEEKQAQEKERETKARNIMELFFRNVGAGCKREEPGDYRNEQGFLMCGKCHEPKEIEQSIPYLGVRRHYTMCACQRAEADARDEKERISREQQQVDELFQYSLIDGRFKESTFDKYIVTDENRKAYTIAKNYVAKFDELYKRHKGLLFYGDTGTGKTFLSSCIANELLKMRIPIIVTSILRLTSATGPFSREAEEQQIFLEKMNSARVLFIDDLGTERTTDYKMEQVFEVINSRYGSKRPMIITTNIPIKKLAEDPDIRKKRIYDRILEVCYPVHCQGYSWRYAKARTDMNELTGMLTEGL